jgi:hypothetical protein
VIKVIALRGIVGATLLITMAYLSAFLPGGTPTWAPWIFLLGMSVIMVATMALGAARDGEATGLKGLFAFLILVQLGAFGAALALPASEGAGSPLFLGLPLRAALVLYLAGLVPVIVVPIFYARTFHALALRPGDVERVRAEAQAARASQGLGSTDRGLESTDRGLGGTDQGHASTAPHAGEHP